MLDPGLFFGFVIFFTQTVGLLEQEISLAQDRCLYSGQHKHRINEHIGIHVLSGIRTPSDHIDRPYLLLHLHTYLNEE
jgi:hypothetical protein